MSTRGIFLPWFPSSLSIHTHFAHTNECCVLGQGEQDFCTPAPVWLGLTALPLLRALESQCKPCTPQHSDARLLCIEPFLSSILSEPGLFPAALVKVENSKAAWR